jgi:FMN phosphatase YigB (HAD superfamily)
VLNYFKVKPEETIFVGHDKEKIKGARKLGIKTISFSSLKKMKDLN